MRKDERLGLTLLPGARELLAVHARELPQRDDLCGAFCGALALGAAGLQQLDGDLLDQDAVALAAGSIVSAAREMGTLPHGESGRRDYRLELPFVEDSGVSGTTAGGVVRALEQLSQGRLAAIPYAGPWTPAALDGVFALCCEMQSPVTLIANLATRHLWGSGASVSQMLDHLISGAEEGPPPDWDVGHFACVVGRVEGPAGRLYGVADTYPSLGSHGVHLQPEPRLAAAIQRRDMPAGGMIVVVGAGDAEAVRAGAAALGLTEGIWDNGTLTAATLG
jgi:hypothetical protein